MAAPGAAPFPEEPSEAKITSNPAGARIAVDAKQNAALYGEEATPDSILDIRKTKRPAPFDRLVKVRLD